MAECFRKKILIVDDQQEIRSLLFFSLSSMNYKLLLASDGDSALAIFQSNHPDIVILDIMMPGQMNGLDVCRILKADKRPPQVIFLSALARADDIQRGFEAGGDAYITKPFSPMALIREIHKLARDE